jgi:hypothetical protein
MMPSGAGGNTGAGVVDGGVVDVDEVVNNDGKRPQHAGASSHTCSSDWQYSKYSID